MSINSEQDLDDQLIDLIKKGKELDQYKKVLRLFAEDARYNIRDTEKPWWKARLLLGMWDGKTFLSNGEIQIMSLDEDLNCVYTTIEE